MSIQKELMRVLSIYFGADDSCSGPVKNSSAIVDPVELFNNHEKIFKAPLFRFAYSSFSHGDWSSAEAAAPVEKQLICAVHPGNFPLCYRSVHAFLVQIESQFFRASSTDVLLNTLLGAFLNDYGTNTFFTLVKEDAIRALERIRDDYEAFKPAEEGSKPDEPALAKNVLGAESLLQRLLGLCLSLPGHTDALCLIIVNLLSQFLMLCNERFESISAGKTAGRHFTSFVWLSDSELVQLLQQYPSYKALQQNPLGKKLQTSVNSEQKQEIDKETKQLHQKQRAIEERIFPVDHELSNVRIIPSLKNLGTLACLAYSLEWFFNKNHKDHLERFLPSTALLTQKYTKKIFDLLSQLKDLSRNCLLLLKLEIRSQCYFYLLTALKKGNYNLEEDPIQPEANISKWNEVLCSTEEMCSSRLTAVYKRFLFTELELLTNDLLIHKVNLISSINPRGVVLMCRNIYALKQNLINLGINGTELTQSLTYYELLNRPVQGIVDERIKGKNSLFNADQIVQILKLIERSYHIGSDIIAKELARLNAD
ncbi:exocyst complex component 4-like [Zophobas morio]|uniref:exocyst complex component 4-like n=1 Tax=Zophobas morio TaxID=2755281 RepID=UPI003083DC2F